MFLAKNRQKLHLSPNSGAAASLKSKADALYG